MFRPSLGPRRSGTRVYNPLDHEFNSDLDFRVWYLDGAELLFENPLCRDFQPWHYAAMASTIIDPCDPAKIITMSPTNFIAHQRLPLLLFSDDPLEH
jgi:hypothetical protein